jgi:membrane-bound ClpP family serine protease
MNLVSRTITGGVLIIIGLILIVISPFTVFTTLIYGIPILIIGLIIFLNKKEDKIEERKDLNKIKTKR